MITGIVMNSPAGKIPDPLVEYQGLTDQQREDLITTVGIVAIVLLDGLYELINVMNGLPLDTNMLLVGIGGIGTLCGVNITQLAGMFGIKL